MCGILGSFGVTAAAKRLDTALLRHRGPDAEGEWRDSSGSCWLGHTRLSILELSEAGAQPMQSGDGNFVLVFNGEIYNHLDLRKILHKQEWRGTSDTETLIELWSQQGLACLDHLSGMFAFGIYEISSRTLTLVRDGLGIKPVYFRRAASSLSFASEVSPLVESADILSKEALATYLATGHFPVAGKLQGDVQILPPGHYLTFDSNAQIAITRWWPKKRKLPSPTLRSETVTKVRTEVERAVVRHMLSDVPIATFLSGGIDSSVVAVCAARHHSAPLRTFSVGFPQKGLDERPIARLVAEQIGANHTEIEVTDADCLEWIMEAVRCMDLPSVDAINSYIVSKAVRAAGLKVALSGLGGDELFGGYPSFRAVRWLRHLRFIPKSLLAPLLRRLPARIRTKLEDLPHASPYSIALGYRRLWANSEIHAAGVPAEPLWPSLPSAAADWFEEVSWAEIQGYMEPMLLRDSDQMSMAVSLELRVPFLDDRLVEFVLELPAAIKSKSPQKSLLIEAFSDWLPKEVYSRPKQGFSLPMEEWLRGPLADFRKSGLSKAGELIDPLFLRYVEAEFEQGKLHWSRLWQMIVLGHWNQKQDCSDKA